MNATTATAPSYTLGQMVLYMLRLGTFGFGGPVALVGYMHRDLVGAGPGSANRTTRRGWRWLK